MEQARTTRRRFLKGGAAGALVIGFTLPLPTRLEAASAPFAPNAFLRVGADGVVTVVCPAAEMGQGVLTALPMLVAEELDADWSRVRVEQAPADKAYENPVFNTQLTGGSTSVRGMWEPMRKAGAAAREMLVAAAAARWKVDAADCRTEAGKVIHKGGRTLGYGELVATASKLPVPREPKLKDSASFRLLGKPTRRVDTPGKVNGSAKFGIDVQVPGMLVAVMARAPHAGAKPVKVDDSKAKAIKGVRQVITIAAGVAVLADGYWAARKGRDALAIEWDLGALKGLSSAGVSAMLSEGATQANTVALSSGNAKDAAAAAASRLQATYEAPYLAQACMEPLNCTAWVRGDSAEVWVGTQGPGPTQGAVSEAASVPASRVKVNTLLLGGGFGRRAATDFAVDATLLSKASGKPVKLIYTREDDMAAGFYRPAAVAKLEAGLDSQGTLTVLTAGVSAPSIMAAAGMKLPDSGADMFAMEGIADHPYDIANQRLAYGRREPGPQVWFWRSVGHSQNIFFVESFIDELAVAAKKDPFEFRRALLGKQPRYKGVLELAAEKAGWGRPLPAGVFRGIAVSQCFGSYVAEVAEVSVAKDGTPTVHRVVAAVDCGMTVNPMTIARQIEGSIVYGLSAALYGRITFKDGRVEQGNFHDYPVLRMAEMPKVEVHIIPSKEKPGGIGEPGTPPIAPAVANAIFAATGKRLRQLPFDSAALKEA
ncbi:molybdopterin cofactor-binding domain-containing protein [Variovorax sp. DT-64]|uniref:xanthine dehydrogenase family protein molybdopterin-binding subunit n=1 Tax=Variovorax sp. DT-64 TaxID=3396160 RepID=UPI003F1A9FCF